MSDIFACHACGQATHIDLLDAKPGTAAAVDESNPDWCRLECWECYGEGYVSLGFPGAPDPNSEQMKATRRARV